VRFRHKGQVPADRASRLSKLSSLSRARRLGLCALSLSTIVGALATLGTPDALAAVGNGALSSEILAAPIPGWGTLPSSALAPTVSDLQSVENAAAKVTGMTAVAAANGWFSISGQVLVIALIAFVGKPLDPALTDALHIAAKLGAENVCEGSTTVPPKSLRPLASPPGYLSLCQPKDGKMLKGVVFARQNVLAVEAASTITTSQLLQISQRQYAAIPTHGFTPGAPSPPSSLATWASKHGAFVLQLTTDGLHLLAKQVEPYGAALARAVALAKGLPDPPGYAATWTKMVQTLDGLATLCEHPISTRPALVADWSAARTELGSLVQHLNSAGLPLGKQLLSLWDHWAPMLDKPATPATTGTSTSPSSGGVGATLTVTTGQKTYSVRLTAFTNRAEPATPTVTQPKPGDRLVSVHLAITDTGAAEISGDANDSATVTGSNEETYTSAVATVAGCTNFDHGSFQLSHGQSSSGCVAFEIPDAVAASTLKWSPTDGVGAGGVSATWSL
jgi:hypothetical protein